MSGVWRWALWGLVGLTVAGCGDPLVDGEYRGEALLSLSGPVLVPDSFALEGIDGDATAAVRLAVFWATSPDDPDRNFATVSGVEQGLKVTQSSVLRYSVSLYSPPPDGALRRPFLGTGLVALGQVVAYADRDGSGQWSPGEDQLLGGVQNIVLAYSPEGATGPMFPQGLTAGFHRLRATPECHPDYKVRPLQPLGADDDLRLVIQLTGAANVYVDLNCDGTGHEWLPSNCPPTLEELNQVCGPGSPVGDPAHDEFCGFCQEIGVFDECGPQLAGCGGGWPELCAPYQLCIDPNWVVDPHVQCDFELGQCEAGAPPGAPAQPCNDAFQLCLANADCEWGYRACMEELQNEPQCAGDRDACIQGNEAQYRPPPPPPGQ